MSKLPPGDVGYSVIGDKSLEFVRDPIGFVERKIKVHDSMIFKTRLMNTPTIFVCSPDHIKQALSSGDFEHGYRSHGSTLHSIFGDNLLFEEGADAHQVRKCWIDLLKSDTTHHSMILRLAKEFISRLTHSEGKVCVYSEFKDLITQFCLKLFLDVEDQEEVKELSNLATTHWHGMLTPPISISLPFGGGKTTFRHAIDAGHKITNIIKQRLYKTPEKLPDGNRLFEKIRSSQDFPHHSDKEKNLLLFVSAVIPKAFASLITSYILQLAGPDKAEWRDRVRKEDDDFIDCLLLEVERLWPPFFGGRRISKRPTNIEHYQIPKGYALVYCSYTAHRDARYFERAEEFDPERWRSGTSKRSDLFSFGWGSRGCIGTKLIRSMIRTLLRRITTHYDWSVREGYATDYKYLPVLRPTQLPQVIFAPRKLD